MSPHNSRDEFRQLLKENGIDAVFRINPAGSIYSVTFIDHEAGIIANGSLLGKEFLTNALYPAPDVRLQNSDARNENSPRKVIRPIPWPKLPTPYWIRRMRNSKG